MNSCLRAMCMFLLFSLSRIRKVYRKPGGLDKLPAALFRAEALVLRRPKRGSNRGTFCGKGFPKHTFFQGPLTACWSFCGRSEQLCSSGGAFIAACMSWQRSLSARPCELLGLSFRRSGVTSISLPLLRRPWPWEAQTQKNWGRRADVVAVKEGARGVLNLRKNFTFVWHIQKG